jgi:hypothetical protein
MKVILKTDVKKVGKRGEVVDVSDGYARNYLIARGLAVPSTERSMEILAIQKEDEKKQVEDNKQENEPGEEDGEEYNNEDPFKVEQLSPEEIIARRIAPWEKKVAPEEKLTTAASISKAWTAARFILHLRIRICLRTIMILSLRRQMSRIIRTT